MHACDMPNSSHLPSVMILTSLMLIHRPPELSRREIRELTGDTGDLDDPYFEEEDDSTKRRLTLPISKIAKGTWHTSLRFRN